MRTRLVVSWSFNRELNKDKPLKEVSHDFDNLKEDMEVFDDLYRVHHEKVLKLIPRFSGIDWEEDELPVYIVRAEKASSMHDPLTVKFHENPKLTFAIMCYQLIKRNLGGVEGPIAAAQICCVLERVLGELGGFEDEMKMMHGFQKARFKSYEPLSYDLGKKSLKEWIAEVNGERK